MTRLHVTLSDGREVVATGRVTPGRAAILYGPGPVEPADPAEVDDIKVTLDGVELDPASISLEDDVKIADALVNQAEEDAEDDWYAQGEAQRIDHMLNIGGPDSQPDDVP